MRKAACKPIRNLDATPQTRLEIPKNTSKATYLGTANEATVIVIT